MAPVKSFVTAAGIAVVLTAWYGLKDDPLQSAACGQVPASVDVPAFVCPPRYRQLSDAAASDAVDTFLNRAGGSSPAGAFRMLTDESQKSHDGFANAWDTILFADRDASLTRTAGLNTFVVSYATYDGGGDPVAPVRGKVSSYVRKVQVIGPVDDPHIRLVGEVTRGTGLMDEVTYVRSFPVQRMQTYNRTDGRSVAAPKVMPDQPLSLLCQVESNSGWWSRTGWGWARNADLRAGEGRVPGVSLCHSHNASPD